ncbi:hypothetical protein L6164_004424 [Bauhinia variegata]|uniref:Uncharacterized protein n=1 Tax=Bauhinia variegata TaxID=167791 RepID=A0ACB9Q4F0_BAUVA|nr:hypothetical protein L6164_004424 [Bauhinia variegata]
MDLISGLPDDVVRECLIRISYQQFADVAAVCKRWKTEIELPEFRLWRKSAGHNQKLVVMVQARVDLEKSGTGFVKCRPMDPVYGLTIFEPDTGAWSELPLAPGLGSGLPMFCQLAGVGYDLVVMGGWDPNSWKACNSVYIYNFMSAKWRRGADMPGGPRTFFACASDSDRMVYIAGGHDGEKNALRSAFAYDVARDEWVPLPHMSSERDECKAVCQHGKFHVIGGYRSEMQGRFERSAEAFDVGTWKWSQIEEDFLRSATSPRTCVIGDEKIFMCVDGEVVTLQDSTWQVVAQVPSEIRNVAYVRTWIGTLLLIGSSGYGEPHIGFVLDMECCKWRKLEYPERHKGHVQSGCLMEI